MAKRIKANQLGTEVNRIMKEYSKDVGEGLKADVDDVTKAAVKRVKSGAPVGRTGRYKKSWGSKSVEETAHGKARVILSRGRAWLAHLLENPRRARHPDFGRRRIPRGGGRTSFTRGHALRGGGRIGAGNMIPGTPHIRPAEEWAIKELGTRVKRRIQG